MPEWGFLMFLAKAGGDEPTTGTGAFCVQF